MDRSKNGFITLVLLFMTSYMLISVCCLVFIVISCLRIEQSTVLKQKVFYFSVSGIELAKVRMCSDPDWSTDIALTVSKPYLIAVSSGETYLIGDGGCKVIRGKGNNEMYSIGFIGTDIMKSRAYNFQKMTFTLPYTKLRWEEF